MGISVGALEQGVLALLIFNQEYSPLLALKIRPNLFTSRTGQRIAEVCLSYISQYKVAPQNQIEYLLEADFRRGEDGRLLGKTVDSLKEIYPQLQPKFIMDELDSFVELQELSQALVNASDAVSRGDIQQAKEALVQTKFKKDASAGLWLRNPGDMLKSSDTLSDEFFSCGVPALDTIGVRLARKTLTVMIAAAKRGKSWWLIDQGKSGLQFHKKVCHITLENSEEITSRRYLQSIFSLTKEETQQIRIPTFERDSAGGTKIDFNVITRDSVISKRAELWRKLETASSWPDLHIKEFPTSQLTTEHLILYLEALKNERDFAPDELVIDYADLMKIDGAMFRIDTGRLYRELRGVAVMFNCATATASQGNRESDSKKTVDKGEVAEDWSKIGTADLVLTYSQTPQERLLRLARILVAGSRDSIDRVMALISQAYEIGQFCLDSTIMRADISSEIDKLGTAAEAEVEPS